MYHEGQHGLVGALPHVGVAVLKSHEEVLGAGMDLLLVDALRWS